MSRQHHRLKAESYHYQLLEKGIKTFELRVNDRDFQIGDMVTICEVVLGVPTERELPPKEIKYILHGGSNGISETHCIFQL